MKLCQNPVKGCRVAAYQRQASWAKENKKTECKTNAGKNCRASVHFRGIYWQMAVDKNSLLAVALTGITKKDRKERKERKKLKKTN